MAERLTDSQLNLPLFPLSGHVLPGGTMRLRIFEPRYLRMVKEACHGNESRPIGVCMLNKQGQVEHNTDIHAIGTAVTIVDFEQLKDGLLGITVAGHGLFEIQSIDAQADGLRVGQVRPLKGWPPQLLAPHDEFLAEQLQEIYQTYPELSVAASDSELQRADWICLRWLELLPISAATKQELLQHDDCSAALNFLRDLVMESKQ